MTNLSQSAFDEAEVITEFGTQADWLPPEAPLAMPRQILEADRAESVLGWIMRVLMPLRRV